ncbi:MAG: Ig-like domain-containing protein [Patescibacteria group bacterium]|jgi:hypothetical protein
MKLLKTITLPSLAILLITVCGFLFINLFVAIQADGAEIIVQLTNPPNGSVLSGNIYTSARTSSTVSKVEFYFLDDSGRFTFTYEGVNTGDNSWEYTWSTDESIDGVYMVYAIAVDASNLTYISDINRIYVDNAGGGDSIPDFDQNSNSTPILNYNVNQNENVNVNIIPNNNTNLDFNSNININTNVNQNQNTNSIIENTNVPANTNLNIIENINYSPPINGNSNLNQNTNTPTIDAPDDDKDGLNNDEETEAGTDENNPDTDNDGLIDGFEEEHGFNPLIDDNNTPARTPDQKIIQAITDARFGGQEQSKDTDRDGLPDVVEIAFGSDPLRPDSSNDGLTDGFKATNGYSLFEDNSEQIAKKQIELPNPNINSVEKGSLTSTIAIFGALVLIIFIVLIVFRPKTLK